MSKYFKQFYLPIEANNTPFENINGNFVLKNAFQTKNFLANKTGVKIREDGIAMIGGNITYKEKTQVVEAKEAVLQEEIKMVAGSSNKAFFIGGMADAIAETSGGAGSSISRRIDYSIFTAAGTGYAALFEQISDTAFGSLNLRLECNYITVGTTNHDGLIGFSNSGSATPVFPADSILYDNHAGFIIYDGALYASVAKGSSPNQTVSLISDIVPTTMHKYSLVITGSSKAEFYVDDILKTTIITNLPTSTAPFICIGTATSGAPAIVEKLKHPYTILRTD